MSQDNVARAERQPGDTLAFCSECAWRQFAQTGAEADVKEDMHKLRDCPFGIRESRMDGQ